MASFSYACKDFPGMEACPARFVAETEAELWEHIELHARRAHGEDPAAWSPADKDQMKAVIAAAG